MTEEQVAPSPARQIRSRFLAACRGDDHDRVPVWFMRQAGRSLPEYREIRARTSMSDLIRTPDLAAEVTLQPLRRYDVDAAVLFSDILVPVEAVGIGVEIRPGVGPVVDQPLRAASDLDRLRPLEPDEDMAHVLETVRLLVPELDVPLIGFAGGPFTLASYLVEGGPSKSHARTRAMMFGEPELWNRLAKALAGIALASLRAQVLAGAAAVQVFDSWAGVLAPDDYTRYVLPATRRIFEGLADLGVPTIHFAVGAGHLLHELGSAGADAVGVDWRIPLDVARARVPEGIALQGNLDPASLLAGFDVVADRARDVLRRSQSRSDYVFNLGHGVLPRTDPDVLRRLVDLVHDEGRVLPHDQGTADGRGQPSP